ncbi:MAG: DNA-binding protein [Clostridia bacterium]|nr:DNA-binding protein [Clostridia bacterium]
MKNQAYRMTLLYDFYGDLLTDRQKEFYDLYYNEDLSLSEIAENYGITRQGVRDVIVRAEAFLTEIEDKTGIVRRFHKMQEHIQTIEGSLNALTALNEEKYQDDALEALCMQMKSAAQTLKKE